MSRAYTSPSNIKVRYWLDIVSTVFDMVSPFVRTKFVCTSLKRLGFIHASSSREIWKWSLCNHPLNPLLEKEGQGWCYVLLIPLKLLVFMIL
jgi:hypothetical protein